MIVPLPKRPSNDNEAREVWTCRLCDTAAFLLYYEAGATTICCAQCGEDVTANLAPTLVIGIDLCQP